MKTAKQNVHKDKRATVEELHGKIMAEIANDAKIQCEYLLSTALILKELVCDESRRGRTNRVYMHSVHGDAALRSALSSETNDLIESMWGAVSSLKEGQSGSGVCAGCGGTSILIDNKHADEICTDCGLVEHVPMANNTNIYSDCATPTTYFAYKRVNHFKEWLNQVQGKTNTDIAVALNAVRAEMAKERNGQCTTSKVTPAKIRGYLKKHKLGKYYEHVNRIYSIVTDDQAPVFTPELEDKLMAMFREIQIPFDKHCPKTRNNFLSYAYTLNKMCQILHIHSLMEYFPLLKSREKLHAQDVIWMKICKDVGWTFYSSL